MSAEPALAVANALARIAEAIREIETLTPFLAPEAQIALDELPASGPEKFDALRSRVLMRSEAIA